MNFASSVAVPIMVREREARARRATDSSETQVVERKEYIRVPVWLIGILVGLFLALIGDVVSTVWFAATIRSDIDKLSLTMNGTASTSLQSQINELRQDVKTNEERENDTRLRLAAKGIIVK